MKLVFYIAFFLSTTVYGISNFSVTVSFPQNSGLAGVDYKGYSITNGKLYVIESKFNWNAILPDSLQKTDSSTEQYIDDTLSVDLVNKEVLKKIGTLLDKTDEFGDHFADGCFMNMGWPRFFISAAINGRKIKGSIANCYRENIFKVIDLMNLAVPNLTVLNYKKSELVNLEKKCKERNYGRGDKE